MGLVTTLSLLDTHCDSQWKKIIYFILILMMYIIINLFWPIRHTRITVVVF